MHTFPFDTPTQQDTRTCTYTVSHTIWTSIDMYTCTCTHMQNYKCTFGQIHTCMVTNLQSSIHTTTNNMYKCWEQLKIILLPDTQKASNKSTCTHLTTQTQCTSGIYTHYVNSQTEFFQLFSMMYSTEQHSPFRWG